MKLGTFFYGAAVVAGVAAAVACNGKSAGSSGGCTDFANAFSAFANACGGGLEANSRTLEECENLEAAPGVPSSFDSSISSCAALLNSAIPSCGQDSAVLNGGCTTPAGTLAVGGACGSDAQCASGFCLISTTQVTTEEDGGFSETSTVAASQCGLCTATIATGQACNLSQPGTRCAGSTPTASDGFCNTSGATGTGVCAVETQSAAGGACGTEGTNCQNGLRCDETSQKCAALSAAGGACEFSSDCAYPLACANSVCATGVAEGQPCTLPPESSQSNCAPNLGCDLTSNTCKKPNFQVASGGTCDSQTNFCAAGSCVTTGVTNTGTCPTIIADGSACDPASSFGASQCNSGSSCINKVCVFPNPSLCK